VKKILSAIGLAVGAALLVPFGAKAALVINENTIDCSHTCQTDAGTCKNVCVIRATGNTTSLSSFTGTIQIIGDTDKVKVASVTAGDGWTNLSGNSSTLIFNANPAITASEFELARVEFEISDPNANCSWTLSSTDWGVEIEVDTELTEQPNTGDALPIVILAAGAGVALIAYFTASKNKKLYKI
jgi:hypothetical protein